MSGQKNMGGQSKNSASQKNNANELQEAQQLYKSLRRKKVPTALAAVICAAVVVFGVWAGGKPGQQGSQRQTQPSQQTQQQNLSGQDQSAQQIQQSGQSGGSQQPSGGQEIKYEFRTQEQLADHFERHGIEMGYEDEEAYVAGANRVVASPDALHKLEAEDGDDVYYLEETNEFVVVSQKGYIRTYFEPDDGLAYYERQ